MRRANATDLSAVHALIDALADYEKLNRPTPEARLRLAADLFGPKPRVECHLVFLDGYPVGYSILCETYSSFLALPTLYLEDLFVLEDFRARKAGFALFEEARAIAISRGCGRFEWSVLSWNKVAKDFYEKVGGEIMAEWELYRIDLTR